MRYCHTMVLICMLCGSLSGQEELMPIPWRITFTPTAAVGFFPTLQAGAEYRVHPMHRIELEGGYIFAENWIREKFTGPEVRATYKLGRTYGINLIVSMEYRVLRSERFSWEPQNEATFFRATTLSLERNRLSVLMGLGYEFPISPRIMGEWSMSVGRGNRISRERDGDQLLREEDSSRAVGDFGIKLKYLLGQAR